MLALNKRKQYKAYVKRFRNGFGIKTVNTETNAESIIMVTTDKLKSEELQDDDKQEQNPESNNLSKENFDSDPLKKVCSAPHLELDGSSLAISKVLVHLEPYLRELKPDIAGFHIFEEDSDLNLEKASVIFVANTKLAKEKGVHFNIPGELLRVNCKEENYKEVGKQEKRLIIKPITIVVGDYVIHLNICHDSQLHSLSKETQTSNPVNRISDSNLQNNKSTSRVFENTRTNSNSSIKENQSNPKFSKESLLRNTYKLLDALPQNSTDQNNQHDQTNKASKKSFELYLENICDSSHSLNAKSSSSNTNEQVTMPVSSTVIVDDDNGQSSKTTLSLSSNTNEQRFMPVSSTMIVDDDHNGQLSKTTLESKISLDVSSSSNYSFEICSEEGGSNKSTSFVNKQLLNDSNQKVSFQNQFSSSQTSAFPSSGKNLRALSCSKVSLKEIKERLNTVTFSLQQLKSVIEIIDSSENCAILQKHSKCGNFENKSNDFEADDLRSKIYFNNLFCLCDRCGCFYSETELTNHFCGLTRVNSSSRVDSLFEICKSTSSTQEMDKEVISIMKNEELNYSDEQIDIVEKEAFTVIQPDSDELIDQGKIARNKESTSSCEKDENQMKKRKSVVNIDAEKTIKTPRKSYFKFIANRFTKSDTFKIPSQFEKTSREKLTCDKNTNFPDNNAHYLSKQMFNSLGNLLYMTDKFKFNTGKNKPIALKDSPKVVELFSNPTNGSLSSKSLHVMPSSASSVCERENNSKSTLQSLGNEAFPFDSTKIEEFPYDDLESSSSLAYALQSLFAEEQTSSGKEEGKIKLKRKNKVKDKSRRKLHLFCFKI